jgi:hypothetical protein
MKFYGDYGQDPITGDWYKKPTTSATKKPGTVDANVPLFAGNVPGDKVSAVNIMKEDISQLTVTKGDMAFTMYADLIRANKNNYNLSDDAILASVKNYATKQGVTPEQYLDRWAVNIKNKYAELGLKPPPNLEDQLNEYTSTSKSLKNKITMTKSAEIAADKEAGVEKVLGDVLKNKKTINFNVDGNKIVVEPRDMLGLVTSDVEKFFKMPNKSGQQELLKRTDLTNNQRKLIASWDRDTRPDLNGLLIQYLDYKNYLFLDNKFNKIGIENLSNDDLFQLHLYFEQVVPVNFNIPD